jgi:hypothetical protein
MKNSSGKGPAGARPAGVSEFGNFSLGSPAVICRWRLAGRNLPMANRHLRALGARTIGGRRLSRNLVNWAKQHIEWTLDTGAAEHPDGVLMLLVDEDEHAAMTVGPYEPLEDTTLDALLDRAVAASLEASGTGVAPDTLWLVSDGQLRALSPEGNTFSGATSLLRDLAATVGLPFDRAPLPLSHDALVGLAEAADEAFLVSDEHGVVLPQGSTAEDMPLASKLFDSYGRLLEACKDGRR